MKDHWALCGTVLMMLLLYSLLPFGTAVQFGQDEGLEVLKPFIHNQGYGLYTEIWDDQPPLLTKALAATFKVFGASIFSARAVVAILGLVLIATFHELVRRRCGQWCALLAGFFLLASPGFLVLSVSVMQEVPAMAVGFLSVWMVFKWSEKRHWAWLLGSGLIMGLAMQIKFTALLIIPSLVLEMSLLGWEKHPQKWQKELVVNFVLFGVGMTAVSLAIGYTWGKGSFEISWKAHTGTQVVPGIGRAEDWGFNWQLLKMHVECVAGALLGVVIAWRQKRWREIAFPLALLLTDSLIHVVHKPWWNYYYLHVAVPLAWLSAYAAIELIRFVFRLHIQAKQRLNFSSASCWKQVGLVGLVAFVVVISERRIEGTMRDLRQVPHADSNPVVKKMKQHASRTDWVYSESGIFPFHAQLPMPPELVVITLKRYWSGQISAEEIVETCKRYEVEQILLKPAAITRNWVEFLKPDYAIIHEDKDWVLFLRNNIGESKKYGE